MAIKKKKVRVKKDASPMLIEERRQHVLERIQLEGRVLVADLSESLGISRITIRKDLDNLESRGLLQRTHGGALAPQANASVDPSLQVKELRQFREKQRIAEAAAKLVAEGQCVLLDSGTTTTAIARALKSFKQLTVITNAVNIATEVASSGFEVILTGGTLRQNSSSLVGPLAEEALAELNGDILFLGVDGFDPEVGVMTPNVLESRVNRAMVKAARRVVAVCDSTKFSRRSLALIVPPAAIQTVITDSGASGEVLALLRSAGIEVIVV